MMHSKMTVMLLVAVLTMWCVGCSTTHNQTRLNTDGSVEAITSNANTMRTSETGEQQATFHGPASQVWEDADGVKAHIGTPVAVLYFNTGNGSEAAEVSETASTGGTIHLISPNDAKMASFTYTPTPPDGQPMLSITGLEWNVSEPIRAMQETLIAYVEQLAGMSETERQTWLEAERIKGELGSDLLDTIEALLPLLAAL